MNEPGRNEPCWCGSGLKYKKCHMGRERAEKPMISDYLEAEKRARNRKLCLHPDAQDSECEGDIVKAHTVQRAGLAKIAEDGHVHTFVQDVSLLRSGGGKRHAIVPRRVGIGSASTFTGFCEKHDNDTFRPIEDEDIECSNEHAFLLAYRALCHALYKKKAALEYLPFMRGVDAGQPVPIQMAVQQFAGSFIEGNEAGHRDLAQIKRQYDSVLKGRDYSNIRYYAILFEECPDVMCSGSFWPEFDFAGQQVQEPVKPNPEGMQFSLMSSKDGGIAMFTWIKSRGVCEAFVETLHQIADVDLANAILRFVFEYFENTYFRSAWWESLDKSKRTRLHDRMAMMNSITVEHQPKCLIDDGLRVVNWEIEGRRTNVRIHV